MRYTLLQILILPLLCLGCTDETETRNTLTKAGFTDVEITGYAFFSCGEDDTYRTAFRAKNPVGNTVEGAVCCGTFKGCTIRF